VHETTSHCTYLKRNDDRRLNKPVRDFTNGALADDFRLHGNTTNIKASGPVAPTKLKFKYHLNPEIIVN